MSLVYICPYVKSKESQTNQPALDRYESQTKLYRMRIQNRTTILLNQKAFRMLKARRMEPEYILIKTLLNAFTYTMGSY